jgi:8-oxo-dGTP pyrophosphatase MutT (NUDIX family)
MSFGVIAVKFVENTPHYLMIRRRDTLSYVDFMRGKYKMEKQAYIQMLIDGMTAEEHERLLRLPFDTLWVNLWNHVHTRQYRNEYENAKRTFETLKTTGDVYGRMLNKYIHDASTNWTEPEWGFPKGRRSLHEPEQACALREFGEETGFPTHHVSIASDVPPIIEDYVGSNGIPYKHVYYIGVCSTDAVVAFQPSNRVMSREVSGIEWKPFDSAFLSIRPTNPEKRTVLSKLHYMLMREGLREKICELR